MGDLRPSLSVSVTQRNNLQISNPSIFSTPSMAGSPTSTDESAFTAPASISLEASSDRIFVSNGVTVVAPSSSISTVYTSSSGLTCPSVCATGANIAPITIDDSAKITGLIAGLVLFAMLFLVMTSLVIWILCKKPRNQYKAPYVSISERKSLNPSVTGMEHTIASLESELHEKDSELREKQMSLLIKGIPISRTQTINRMSLSDDQIGEKIGALQRAISDWVVLYFGTAKFVTTPVSDISKTLQKTFPQYEHLIKDNGMVKVVLEGVVSETICQALATGQLLGNEAFWELKQAFQANVSAKEANEWRAMTARLLERIPGYQSDRIEAVEDLSQTIDGLCSSLTKIRAKSERRTALEQVVDLAAALALDMAKQSALFKFEKPVGLTFNADTMIAWGNQQDVTGKQIRAVMFPTITKRGGDAGGAWNVNRIVIKAQVLI